MSGVPHARRLEIGRVGRPHGVRGEVAVTLTSNRPERVAPGAVLYAGERALVVGSSRPHGGRWLVVFEGVQDRDAADTLKGVVLTGEPLGPLPEGETWLHELIGAEVHDRAGALLGRVREIEVNPAHDILVLESGALIPVVFVVEHRAGRVVVDPPEGLLDLYQPG